MAPQCHVPSRIVKQGLGVTKFAFADVSQTMQVQLGQIWAKIDRVSAVRRFWAESPFPEQLLDSCWATAGQLRGSPCFPVIFRSLHSRCQHPPLQGRRHLSRAWAQEHKSRRGESESERRPTSPRSRPSSPKLGPKEWSVKAAPPKCQTRLRFDRSRNMAEIAPESANLADLFARIGPELAKLTPSLVSPKTSNSPRTKND